MRSGRADLQGNLTDSLVEPSTEDSPCIFGQVGKRGRLSGAEVDHGEWHESVRVPPLGRPGPLQAAEYPDILRQPAGYVLERFDAGGAGLVASWYCFMLTAVLFVPLVVLVHLVLAGDGREAGEPFYLGLATAFGVVAGVMQFLGLVRWPFLVPYLADLYTDPASSEATRESAAVVFEAFNWYAGVAVGEHLGYLFTGLWTALVALALLRSPLFGRFGRWPCAGSTPTATR